MAGSSGFQTFGRLEVQMVSKLGQQKFGRSRARTDGCPDVRKFRSPEARVFGSSGVRAVRKSEVQIFGFPEVRKFGKSGVEESRTCTPRRHRIYVGAMDVRPRAPSCSSPYDMLQGTSSVFAGTHRGLWGNRWAKRTDCPIAPRSRSRRARLP